MRRSTILILGCLLGLSIMLGQLLARPTSGQGEAPPPRVPGRYQMAVHGDAMFVIDTTNGRCWAMVDAEPDKWRDLGSPLEPKKQ
jgi:hypothetical protein